jgi:type II secretory pathway predicted ATPase ExeA
VSAFKLKEAPFEAKADARYLYLSKSHAQAKAYLESVISDGEDFVVISGEEGSGKTMLVNTFRQELDKKVVVAHLTQAPISTNEFLQALLEQFGYIPFRGNKTALLTTLNSYLAEQRAAGRKVLVLIDEAQNLAPAVFEQIRGLVAGEPGQESPLRIVLVGQPALSRQLDAPEFAPLAQRARLRYHLTSLTPDQAHRYIVHRLAIAGSHGREIFAPECFAVIDRYTGGAPRLINTLCDAALRIAGDARRDHVLAEDVEAAALKLHMPALTEYAPAPDPPEASPAPPPEREAPDAIFAAAPSATPAPVPVPAPAAAPAPEPAVSYAPAPIEAPTEPPLLPKDLAGPRVGRLRVMSSGGLLIEHTLRTGRMMIGRAPDADLQIEDRTISRHHCQIISNEFLSVIQDLNSTNGVYVRNRRVRRHNLCDGDVVVLGSFQVRYLDEREGEQPDYQGEFAQPPRVLQEQDGESTQN